MLSVSNISVQFGSKKLFNDVSFIVNPRDRIGLVGSNGSGKTTLLRIINGELEPDSGIAARSKHTTVDYLPQDGITYAGRELFDEVHLAVSDIAQVKKEIDEINGELSSFDDKNSPEYLDLVDQLGELQHRFEELDGFKIKSKIEKVLMGLGFKVGDLTGQTDEFSGGWQMRICLAKLLIKNPSVLLLDEPTNHLDLDSLLWLEGFLRAYEGAVIIVSHDRTFLDNMTDRTIEIYTGKVKLYNGNFSFYEKEKHSRKELLEKRFLNQQKYLKQQERFIERFRYKAKKASAVQSRIKMLEKLERVELEDEESAIHFNFPPATHSGRKVMELRGISKSYGENLVLDNVNLEIERGDKIGFVGVNGAGKSTLARIIIGTEEFQKGIRKPGHLTQLEFYSQHQADTLNPNRSVLEILDEVAVGEVRKQLRNILGSFLFKGDDVFKSISVLSGGEKSRLALARMLLKHSNFLVLDEPTNHLDMNSKKVLMNALKEYQGTLIIVSHDREFLDGIVNRIIEVRDKNIKLYEGNCSYYLMKKKSEEAKSSETETKEITTDSKRKKSKDLRRTEAETRNRIYRKSKPFRERISNIENEIKVKEERIKEIEIEMLSKSFYKDSGNVIRTNREFTELKERLDNLYHEWFINNEKLKEIEKVL